LVKKPLRDAAGVFQLNEDTHDTLIDKLVPETKGPVMIAAIRYWTTICLILIAVYLVWVNDYPVEIEVPWPINRSFDSNTAVMYFSFFGLGFLIGILTFGVPYMRSAWKMRSLKKRLKAYEEANPPEITPMNLSSDISSETDSEGIPGL
jgi:uncharacterized membrane protein YciS (DUF1049 family)